MIQENQLQDNWNSNGKGIDCYLIFSPSHLENGSNTWGKQFLNLAEKAYPLEELTMGDMKYELAKKCVSVGRSSRRH